ncbi:alpha/beta fold hydrolase [Streptomyces sp. NPDC055722]
MTKNSMSATGSTWAGMVPVDDTALAVTDTGGPGIPVVYLNGQFATQGYWRRVLAELGTGWWHITYDERARGKWKRSADYSFEAAVRDVDAVLAARGVDQALLVGWSYGAVVGAHWPAGTRSAPWARSWSTARVGARVPAFRSWARRGGEARGDGSGSDVPRAGSGSEKDLEVHSES